MDGLEDVYYRAADEGGSFVTAHPITHLTQIRCREELLNEIKSNDIIKDRFDLGIKRVNRWWWSVAFIDKNRVRVETWKADDILDGSKQNTKDTRS